MARAGEPVREEDIRTAKDVVVRGVVEMQITCGALPNVAAAEEWAQPIVEQDAKEIEDQRALERVVGEPGQDRPVAPPPSEARALTTDPDATIVNRALGNYTFGTGRFDGGVRPNHRRVTLRNGVTFTAATAFDANVARRLKLLANIPEWRKKVLDAWLEGKAHGGESVGATAVLKVVESSCRIFGDLAPEQKPEPQVYVGGK